MVKQKKKVKKKLFLLIFAKLYELGWIKTIYNSKTFIVFEKKVILLF